MHTHTYAFNVQTPIHCVHHHRSHDHRNNKVSNTLAKMYHSSSVIDYMPLLLYVAQKVQMRSDFSSSTKPHSLHRSPELLVPKYCRSFRAFVPIIQPMFMFPVGLNIQICVHNISIIVCVCVHRDWRFEAFVDVKIPGAGDDLLSSAAGKPRYIQLERLR